jgi:hypothetical protein
MKAIIEFENGLQATLSDESGWECSDENTRALLEEFFGLNSSAGYDPNPIANQATRAAETFSATVIQAPVTEYEEGRVY